METFSITSVKNKQTQQKHKKITSCYNSTQFFFDSV